MVNLKGQLVDGQTRCKHYHSQLDVIALKFKCCGIYFPCFECHSEDPSSQHTHIKWTRADIDTPGILCGVCTTELSIADYLACNSTCPKCHAKFNPNCAFHYSIYFENDVFEKLQCKRNEQVRSEEEM